jgi:DNA segregation ATPase FtsK/SpoIIIE, S-DNA-T family
LISRVRCATRLARCSSGRPRVLERSSPDAIPPKIVELVKLNACFAVKSWRSNDGFLGDGSFQAGIRATELRMGKDVGTSILTGATAERFEIVKWFYIEADGDTGYDAAADIITRAMTNLHPAVAAPAGGQEEPAPVVRDLLDDIATVLGAGRWAAEKVPAADVPARLRWPGEPCPHSTRTHVRSQVSAKIL